MMELEGNIPQSVNPMPNSLLEWSPYFQKFQQFIKALNDSEFKLDNYNFAGMTSNLRVAIPMLNNVKELEALYFKMFSSIP